MGESELKIALKREGDEQIRAFWQKVEANVSAQRKRIEMKREQIRSKADQKLQSEIVALRNTLFFNSQARALERRLHGEADLENRLLQLAYELLPEMAGENRDNLWQALRSELPESEWTTLKVHPADRELAERYFPNATIECDEALGGGLIAFSADGVINIDNSLRCRLLRSWPDLLPQLMTELRKLVNNHETTENRKSV